MGARICGAISSRNVAGWMSRVVPTRPESRMKRIHFDMSVTLDHTEPADATPSVLCTGTTRTLSFTSACGTATFALPWIAETRASVSVMPSGAKIRVRTNASHGMPEMRSTSAPPIEYTTFWYCHVERNDAVGFT